MALSKDGAYEVVSGKVSTPRWRGDIYALERGRPSDIVAFLTEEKFRIRITCHAVEKFKDNGKPTYHSILNFSRVVAEEVQDSLTLEDFSKALEYGSKIRIIRLGMNNNRMLNMGLPVDRKSGVTYYQVVMRPSVELGRFKVLEIFSIKKHRGKEAYGTDDDPSHYRTFSVDNQKPKKSPPPSRKAESDPPGHVHQPPPPAVHTPLYDSMTGQPLHRFDPMTGQPLGGPGVPVAPVTAAGPVYPVYPGYQSTWGPPAPPDTPTSPEGRDRGRKRSLSPSEPVPSRSTRHYHAGYYYDTTGNL